jgi:hypothetical protein
MPNLAESGGLDNWLTGGMPSRLGKFERFAGAGHFHIK